jgi:adenosylcobinamide kinase/adenosylcobinamide-phosphate guanylyltransferase
MDEALAVASSELIIGGQRSGKSRRAESLATAWLARSARHHAVMIATGQPWDDEMKERIARHQQDRAARLPAMTLVEESLDLPNAITRSSTADTLIVVDCLTLWLTNWLMPPDALPVEDRPRGDVPLQALLQAIHHAPGPIALVSNEIGLGVIPMGREVRAFVDAQGRLNQEMAKVCSRVTLMVAGLPMMVKDAT